MNLKIQLIGSGAEVVCNKYKMKYFFPQKHSERYCDSFTKNIYYRILFVLKFALVNVCSIYY